MAAPSGSSGTRHLLSRGGRGLGCCLGPVRSAGRKVKGMGVLVGVVVVDGCVFEWRGRLLGWLLDLLMG